jgi:hypothetical protein
MPSQSCRRAQSPQWSGLPLGAGFLHPIPATAGRVSAITDLRDDAFQPDLARVLEHLSAVDFEAFAELDVGPVDGLLQMLLALDQRQLSKVIAIEIEEVESDQDDLGGL